MKFRLDDYNYSHVMHCSDYEQAEIFEKHLDSLGLSWASGRPYAQDISWEPSGGGTCYRFKTGRRDSFRTYQPQADIIILEFCDFDWSEEACSDQMIIMSYEDAMVFE